MLKFDGAKVTGLLAAGNRQLCEVGNLSGERVIPADTSQVPEGLGLMACYGWQEIGVYLN